jgi:hypothetical protein
MLVQFGGKLLPVRDGWQAVARKASMACESRRTICVFSVHLVLICV